MYSCRKVPSLPNVGIPQIRCRKVVSLPSVGLGMSPCRCKILRMFSKVIKLCGHRGEAPVLFSLLTLESRRNRGVPFYTGVAT